MMSNDDKTKSTPQNNKNWNAFWLGIIFLLCISPIIFIYFNNTQSNKNYLEEISSKNMIYSCKSKTECQGVQRKIQQIKYEIHKEYIENIQIKIDNQDKIINSLTFSVSLYAVLITVISIFFSLRESQRIDKALDDINNFKEKLDDTLNQKYNDIDEKLSEIDEKRSEIDKRLKRLNSKVDNFKGEYNEFVKGLDSSFSETKEKTEDFIQQSVGRDTDISDEIKNDVLKNKTDENNKNKNELYFTHSPIKINKS
ncbi:MULTISPECIES: hypothetical protein [Neisseria]|uniref:Uncharacterized protein n=1 Tax=Neisseria subflava TaxID=28449 RepID=A0AAW6Y7E6_NEISU|nr:MULTISPECIES: hypothetical protein [Neisseria]MDK7242724.1 hypothetical protein [Neisseria subflava]